MWEVPGGFSDIILKLISRCAKLTGNQLPTGVAQTWTTTKFSQYWTQRLSVALQRNTARMVLQAVARLQRDYSGYMPDPSAAAYFGNGSDMRASNQVAAVAVARDSVKCCSSAALPSRKRARNAATEPGPLLPVCGTADMLRRAQQNAGRSPASQRPAELGCRR